MKKERKFRKNDIVTCKKHDRLMVVEKYRTVEKSISKTKVDTPVVVSEGGYYDENDLTLIFRKYMKGEF